MPMRLLPQNRRNPLATVGPIGGCDRAVTADVPDAGYLRKVAIRLMEVAQAVRDQDVKLDLIDLAGRFEKLARHLETKNSASDV